MPEEAPTPKLVDGRRTPSGGDRFNTGRRRTMYGPYGIVGLIVVVILIIILLRLVGLI